MFEKSKCKIVNYVSESRNSNLVSDWVATSPMASIDNRWWKLIFQCIFGQFRGVKFSSRAKNWFLASKNEPFCNQSQKIESSSCSFVVTHPTITLISFIFNNFSHWRYLRTKRDTMIASMRSWDIKDYFCFFLPIFDPGKPCLVSNWYTSFHCLNGHWGYVSMQYTDTD